MLHIWLRVEFYNDAEGRGGGECEAVHEAGGGEDGEQGREAGVEGWRRQ